MTILTLNAGSSSLKLALFGAGAERLASGMVDGIGEGARLVLRPGPDGDGGGDADCAGVPDRAADVNRAVVADRAVDAPNHAAALDAALEALAGRAEGVAAVGHRIVHGGPGRGDPMVLDAPALEALEALAPLAPLHQPHNLAGVRAAARAFPGALQVGAFDTAFHAGKPRLHDAYAIPRRYWEAGVRRYGFHGLSYASVVETLAESDPALARSRLAIAHLGNGASVCAVSGGRSLACSMGFSAAEGLVMGTRAGRIDPGVLLWLMREEGMDADRLERLLYRESGMLALSEVSHDMRAILAAGTAQAREALDHYAQRAAEEVARMAVVLGGLDALVFCGGVGENAAPVRDAIADRLAFLGPDLPVRVVPTDEERVIADAARRLLASGGRGGGAS